MNPALRHWLLLATIALLAGCALRPGGPSLERVRVSPDRRGFVLHPSGARFSPWGFNYDHDHANRLLEDYWEREWASVEEDFEEMKGLGANVVRVHLQFGRFMRSETEPDRQALARYRRLLRLAERAGLRLDVTGLGCYHKQDVPAWYDALEDERRWAAQAAFWRAVARAGRGSNAIFCYDLMNEPVAPAGPGRGKDWLGPPMGDKHFVQWIARETRGRERPAIARAWAHQLVAAIRAEDPNALVTVGLVPWSLPRPGLDSGFHPSALAPELDFISVHLYPERNKVPEAVETLKAFAAGKPVLVEETFALGCSLEEFAEFFRQAQPYAAGWISFYWGRTPSQLRASGQLRDAIVAAWLDWFQRARP